MATENNDTNDLAPHYTSQSVLAWLQKMAVSYKLERGEDLLEVISREDSCVDVTNCKNNDSKTPSLLQLAAACARTSLPIASHDFLRNPSDAIYNYGNMAFLDGFGYEWEEFVRLPSRKCVKTDEEVGERQQLLDSVKTSAIASDKGVGGRDEDGRIGVEDNGDLASNYDNLIRVRKDGKSILLKGVNLWNVYDICSDEDVDNLDTVRSSIEHGEIKTIGQAVWIGHVEYID